MNIEVFSLCDAATADGGKLSMLGSFDTIWSTKNPIVHPQCTIALKIRFSRSERGSHKVQVNFVTFDGKNVIQPTQGEIKIDFPEEQSSASANLIFNIQGLKLESFGEYSIDLAIDGEQKSSLPLFVKQHK